MYADPELCRIVSDQSFRELHIPFIGSYTTFHMRTSGSAVPVSTKLCSKSAVPVSTELCSNAVPVSTKLCLQYQLALSYVPSSTS